MLNVRHGTLLFVFVQKSTMLNAGAKVHKIFETSKYKVLNQRNFSLFMQNSPEWKKENGHKILLAKFKACSMVGAMS